MAHSTRRGVSLTKAIFLCLFATAHADVIVRWNMYEGYDADAGANYGLTTHPNGGGEVVAALGPSAAEPKVTPRPGDRISIAVTLPKVPSAAALAELRAGMLADERVKFVF